MGGRVAGYAGHNRRRSIGLITGAKETQNAYLSRFEALERAADTTESWLHPIRKDAIRRFAELGFPTTRMEEWKYTSVAAIARTDFHPSSAASDNVTAEDLKRSPLADLDSIRLVFVNGRYSEKLSSLLTPEDAAADRLIVTSLHAAIRDENPAVRAHLSRYARYDEQAFVALNTAFIEDGAFIEIPRGLIVEKPIHILYVSTPSEQATISHPRTLILANRESQATIIEDYISVADNLYFTNAVTEIIAGENAVIEHYKMQQESDQAFHIATIQVHQARTSTLRSHSISLGGALVRNDLNTTLDGEGADCSLNGLYVTAGRQHIDNHTIVDHAMAHCTSRELYKGILDGKSTAVFNGAVIVRKDAQKTDSSQTNKNLLLSDEAVINTKPQLEIYADDVKCTHGATIGQMDREAIFYLRSRGIGEQMAYTMLTAAFAHDILGRMKSEQVRARIEAALSTRLDFKENL